MVLRVKKPYLQLRSQPGHKETALNGQGIIDEAVISVRELENSPLWFAITGRPSIYTENVCNAAYRPAWGHWTMTIQTLGVANNAYESYYT
jgi:hypothetical protein